MLFFSLFVTSSTVDYSRLPPPPAPVMPLHSEIQPTAAESQGTEPVSAFTAVTETLPDSQIYRESYVDDSLSPEEQQEGRESVQEASRSGFANKIIAKRKRRRNYVAQEILTTEETYVHGLTLLIRVDSLTLLFDCSIYVRDQVYLNPIETSGLLAEDELQAIFGGIDILEVLCIACYCHLKCSQI